MKIAVVGLQGAVSEHIEATKNAMENMGLRKGTVIRARIPEELKGANGIILPGGESTTIGKLALEKGLRSEIIKMAKKGLPVFGTCAGLVLMAKALKNDKSNSSKRLLGLLDITVNRNAFGTQKESFEKQVEVKGIGKVNGVFIRAPVIDKVNNPGIKVIAKLGSRIVGVEKGNLLGLSFHPELTEDTSVHEYFLGMCKTG